MTDPSFTDADCELVAREPLYSGFFRLERWHLRHRLFAGGWTGTFTREVFVRHAAAVALLVDPARECVVMIEQFRAPAIGRGATPWLLELVAGLIDKDESPEEVVRREAVEEAGCRVHRVPFAEAQRLLDDGHINNAATLIALQWLLLNRERLATLLAVPV